MTTKTVREAMRPPGVPMTHVDHPLSEALKRMRADGAAFAPIVDGDQIVGVLDLERLAAYPRGGVHDRRTLLVRDRMTTVIPFVYEDDALSFAAAVARAAGQRHFCVVDHGRRLIGILSFAGPRATAADPGAKGIEVDEATARRRLAFGVGRATLPEHGDPGGYAVGPVLYAPTRPPGRTSGRTSG